MAVPALRFALFPVGRKTVSSSAEPIDAVALSELPEDGTPVRVELRADDGRNAWASADAVMLGAAWVRRLEDGSVTALSSVCPHLGCAVDYSASSVAFECPCHKSRFSLSGDKSEGSPAKRGMDPLPVRVDGDRVHITFIRYKQDIAERVPS